MRRALASHAASFVAGAIIATAVAAQAVPRGSAGQDRYKTLDTFAQALSYIANDYVEPVDERRLLYGAIEGMVSRLDTHSSFLSAARYQQLREDTEGEFGGVGLTVGEGDTRKKPGYPVVEEVVDGSPAARAGIAVGDRLVSIAGRPTTGRGVERRGSAWHSVLRGASGSRVKLEILSRGARAPRSVELVRERVKVPTVEAHMMSAGIGYAGVRKFQEATHADLSAALGEMNRDSRLQVLILDLRGNPGGLLDQAIAVADLFLHSGAIVTVRGRRGTKIEREHAHAAGTWRQLRLLVLVDQGSASAAEIVAGALQDHGRAQILGLKTYGKGSVQTFLDLKDGSGLKLTTARYYTPDGRSLEGAGITPDIQVEAFAPEVVVAGADSADTASRTPAKRGKLAKLFEEDYQLHVAYQHARRLLRTK